MTKNVIPILLLSKLSMTAARTHLVSLFH